MNNSRWLAALGLCGSLLGINWNGTAAVPYTALPQPILFQGMCDASAAVSLGTNLFIVANDEDNILRVYHWDGGPPVASFDVTHFLRIGKKSPEADIEAAAHVDHVIYWITSHGRNAKGKDSPNRERFFATRWTLTNGTVKLTPLGRPYTRLLDDLIFAPNLTPFRLAGASLKPPKAPGALNIEGLTATPEGTLLIGFRNPIPRGRALIVPLLNPQEVILGQSARLGDPILLDLGGLGIRSMGNNGTNYFLIAGPYHAEGESRAYYWTGGTNQPQHLAELHFAGASPEGVVFNRTPTQSELFVLSDDGTIQVNGIDCKHLPDPNQRHFRGYRLPLSEAFDNLAPPWPEGKVRSSELQQPAAHGR